MSKYSTHNSDHTLPVREAQVFPIHAGKAIIVTGGTGGIGRATCQLLAAQGARVAVVDLDQSKADQAAAELGNGSVGVAMNIADEASVSEGFAACIAALGQIHGLINCAAIVLHSDPMAISRADWQKQFDINLFGAYEISRLTAAHMIEHKIKGAIVGIASEAGKKGHAESLAYSASKAGVISMTRMLSESLAPYDINVNCVCPGGVATPMLREVSVAYSAITSEPAAAVFDQMTNVQLKRHIQSIEVARIASFLLTDDAMLIRGQAVNADGGETPY